MTDESAFKKQVRTRMAETGENYTTARRTVIAGRGAARPLPALRVYLSPHVDLELPDAAVRAYEAADEQGKRAMANRLLAEHIEMAGAGEAGIAAGSEIATAQQRHIEEITDVIRRQIPQAAGITSIAVGRDLDHVRVDIRAVRPGAAFGHGGAEVDRLRAELEELIGKPFQLNIGADAAQPAEPGQTPAGSTPEALRECRASSEATVSRIKRSRTLGSTGVRLGVIRRLMCDAYPTADVRHVV